MTAEFENAYASFHRRLNLGQFKALIPDKSPAPSAAARANYVFWRTLAKDTTVGDDLDRIVAAEVMIVLSYVITNSPAERTFGHLRNLEHNNRKLAGATYAADALFLTANGVPYKALCRRRSEALLKGWGSSYQTVRARTFLRAPRAEGAPAAAQPDRNHGRRPNRPRGSRRRWRV